MTLRDENASVRQQRERVLSVFPEAEMSSSARQLQNVQMKANGLLSLVESVASGPDSDLQQAVIELRRAVNATVSAVEKEWVHQVESVVSKHERLSQALQRAGVRGSQELQTSVGRLREMTKPPRSSEEARRASEAVQSVGPILTRLGLEDGLGGTVGGFLTSVADGKGSAKAILEPEVQAFLDTHDLWSDLAVGFK
jgi:hypothetical protein